MLRRSVIALALVSPLLLAPTAGAAGAVPYRGATAQDREIKLIVDRRGRVKRGSFSARTDCGARFKPFAGEFVFRAPLDHISAKRFHDEGSTVDSDDVHTARYRWDIRGKRKGRRKITGHFSVEIVFRRDGTKYATCSADDVAYSAKRSRRRG